MKIKTTTTLLLLVLLSAWNAIASGGYTYSEMFAFSTAPPEGGIFVKVVETAGTNMVKRIGYEYTIEHVDDEDDVQDWIKIIDLDENGSAFLPAPDDPGIYNITDDFLDEIILYNQYNMRIGRIPFSYSFDWEEMHTRHVILFLHNDEEISGTSLQNYQIRLMDTILSPDKTT